MLEEILHILNVKHAVDRVISNGGASGVDGMQIDNLRDYLNTHWQSLRSDILSGTYRPQAVRKVEIPKASGGNVCWVSLRSSTVLFSKAFPNDLG